jgi:hypothetical protein
MFSRLSPKHPKATRVAFTLTEMLVAVAVVVALAFFGLGAMRNALKSARSSQSLANMRQISAGLLSYVADNQGKFPDNREPDLSFKFSWELQIFPYIGIEDGYSGAQTNPQVKPGLNLEMFCCPLDARKISPADAFYPRSYGITAATVYMVVPGLSNQPFDGGISGRRLGEGLRMSVIRSPSKYVLLCRGGKDWETTANKVGALSQSVYNGPDPKNPPLWEAYRPVFGSKTPYVFADGHAAFFDQQEALEIQPYMMDVTK